MEDKNININEADMFRVIYPYEIEHETTVTEKKDNSTGLIKWGKMNDFPCKLLSAVENSVTLSTLVNTVANYISGEGPEEETELVNYDLIHDIAESFAIFGGFAISVRRPAKVKSQKILKLDALDMRCLRTSDSHDKFFWSNKLKEGKGNTKQGTDINKFSPSSTDPTSIYYYWNSRYYTYPQPMWASAMTEAIMEAKISDFHLNSIENGFSSNVVVNIFNAGQLSKEGKDELEDGIRDKFCGGKSVGTPVVAFSKDENKRIEIQPLNIDSFADRYTALTDNIKEKLYSSFRCSPSLCGIVEVGTGFNSTEYSDEYSLFFANVIRPMQKVIEKALTEITGKRVNIKPLTVKFTDNENVTTPYDERNI